MSCAYFAMMLLIIETSPLSSHSLIKHPLKVEALIVPYLNLFVFVYLEFWVFMEENIAFEESIHQLILDEVNTLIKHYRILVPLFMQALVEKRSDLVIEQSVPAWYIRNEKKWAWTWRITLRQYNEKFNRR